MVRMVVTNLDLLLILEGEDSCIVRIFQYASNGRLRGNQTTARDFRGKVPWLTVNKSGIQDNR